MSDTDLPELTRLVESFGETDLVEVPQPQAARLTVTDAELTVIEELSPLIGVTPRAVKRFINVYLLLTSMGRSRGWPLPEQGQVALLAIATGLLPLTVVVRRPGGRNLRGSTPGWLSIRSGVTSTCPERAAGSTSSCVFVSTASGRR